VTGLNKVYVAGLEHMPLLPSFRYGRGGRFGPYTTCSVLPERFLVLLLGLRSRDANIL
jgi:hypothetical protein